jgi:peptide/nickel transport system substrate-binding protein
MLRLRLVVGLSLLAVGAFAALARPWERATARFAPVLTAAPLQDPGLGPGLLPVDVFHPERRPRPDGTLPPLPPPAYGGRVIVHLDAMPKSLCATIDNSGITRRILYEVHETLLLRDWETTEWKPDLSLRWEVQDRLVPKPGAQVPPPEFLIGAIRDVGDAWFVDPKPGYVSTDTPRIAKADVESVERGTVLTFHLRPGVRWHDGHPFDARDVAFSCRIYENKSVDCGEIRQRFLKVEKAEILDYLTVRFTCARQYFNALDTLGDMCILPAHLYDLSDPDNEDGNRMRAANPGWTPGEKEEARYVNENPHNRDWIGLGPYRVAQWTSDSVEAVRFDGYFDPMNAGYVDTIRWRAIPDSDAAFQATLNGELDFFPRMSAEDYFGGSTQVQAFTERFYKGYFYTPNYWYVGWNLYRPQLADVSVRRALAMLFDFEEFKRTFYKGLAVQVTGPGSVYAPGYDRNLKPLPYDPAKAAALLDQAGWTDHDGDGVRDKDGVALEIELLTPPNDKVGTAFGSKYQENLARVGVRLRLTGVEWAALIERRRDRNFDAVALGWSPPLESDPEQIWHSRWGGKDQRSSNFVGLQDRPVDELIDRGQRELDARKRAGIWQELHRRIYDLQPYLFCYNSPRKFAMSRSIRGFQIVPLDPNYVIRRWFYPEGTPGTRPKLAASAAGDRASEKGK